MGFLITSVLLLLTLCGVEAFNYSLKVTNDERRVIDLGVFGFGEGGTTELSVNLTATGEGKIGFLLELVGTAAGARLERTDAIAQLRASEKCFATESVAGNPPRYDVALGPVLAAARKVENAAASFSVRVPGLYALFFYNCLTKADGSVPATFSVAVRQFNRYQSADGVPRLSYLSVGEENLPTMLLAFAVVFTVGLVSWVRSCLALPHRVFAVHRLITALLVVKVLTLLLDAAVLLHRKHTGGLQSGLDYVFYAFHTLKGVMLFTVIMLLGTGWSTLKPFLSERDKKVLYAILPLQVALNIAMAVVDETSEGSRSWDRYRLALRLFDAVCCIAVMLPVVWSIRTLLSTTAGKKSASSKSLNRLQQFKGFYLAVLAFIYFTRVVIPFAEAMLPYTFTWAPTFLYEASAFLFYIYFGSQFKPAEADTMFEPAHPSDEDDDAGEVDLSDAP